MPVIHRVVLVRLRGLALISILSIQATLPAPCRSQQPPSNVLPGASAASPAANGNFVGTILDPYTGKQYDRYLEQENVPVQRWEQQEVSERRLIPQWVTETMKTTETRYVPYVEYQPRQHVTNAWNPFARPQVAIEYVQVTRYQPVNQVVERPVTYQKYVEQDVKVLVPKLVQATEARMKYVDRERPSSGSPIAASSNTIQNAADLAMAQRNQATRYETRPMDAWYGAAPATVYPNYAYTAGQMPPVNSYAAMAPTLRWPSWIQSQGPLFQQQSANRSPTLANAQPAVGSIYYPIASNSGVNGMLRPSTSPMLPSSASTAWGGNANMVPYRDSTQSGIPPTALR